MIKRTLCALMSLTLLIFVLPLTAAADEGLPAQGSATAGPVETLLIARYAALRARADAATSTAVWPVAASPQSLG